MILTTTFWPTEGQRPMNQSEQELHVSKSAKTILQLFINAQTVHVRYQFSNNFIAHTISVLDHLKFFVFEFVVIQ